MRRSVLSLLMLALVCQTVTGEQERTADAQFQEAWYLEEGLRDPARAVVMYLEIESKYKDRRSLAAKALTRAATCYKKLGKVDLERDIWFRVVKEYKDEIEKSPEYQHDAFRFMAMMNKVLDMGVWSDTANRVLSQLLDTTPQVNIIRERDRLMQQAEEQAEVDPLGAVESLRLAILLSTKLKDDATAVATLSGIGEIWFEHGAYMLAIQAYDEARNTYGNQLDTLAWNEMKMAEAFRLLDMTLSAIEHYNSLLKSGQTQQVLWGKLWLGDYYRELGRTDSAIELWQDVAERGSGRQQRIARVLTGLDAPTNEVPGDGKDVFANDEAYFMAIRHEMDGSREAAHQLLRRTMEISNGKDWPYKLASERLADINPGGGN